MRNANCSDGEVSRAMDSLDQEYIESEAQLFSRKSKEIDTRIRNMREVSESHLVSARFDEDENTRDESTPAKWLQTATSTTKLTNSNRMEPSLLGAALR